MNRFLFLLTLFLLAGCDHPAPTVAPLPVQVETAQRQEAPSRGTRSGRVEAWQTSTLSSQVADRVAARPVLRGERVRQGQLLVRFESDTAQAQLDQAVAGAARAAAARRQAEAGLARATVETRAGVDSARAGLSEASAQEAKARAYTRAQELRSVEATLAAARADEELAQREYRRYSGLVEQDAAPRQSLDQAEATLKASQARRRSAEESLSLATEGARAEDQAAAHAQVARARASLQSAEAGPIRLEELRAQVASLAAQEAEAQALAEQYRIQLDHHVVEAPFGGRVLETMVEPGEAVSTGQALVKLGDLSRVKALFEIPEEARAELKLGQQVTVTADALPGRRFHGKLRSLGAEANLQTRTFRVEVAMENPDEAMLPNMVVRLALPGQTSEHPLTIPMAAVVSQEREPTVYVVRSGRAERRPVSLGAAFEDRVEVLEGLAEGESVVTTPIRITPETPVQEVTI